MTLRWLVGLLLGALVLISSGANAQQRSSNAGHFTTREASGGEFLAGFLTWNDGVGSIRWSAALSEDPGGPQTSGAADRYTSDPVPRSYHIDPDRLAQVDLFTQGWKTSATLGTSCWSPNLGGELRAGEDLIGGAVPGWTIFNVGPGPSQVEFLPDQEGFGVCRLRMALEVGRLNAGDVLTLTVTNSRYAAEGGNRPPYGMAGQHQSILRIPVYSDEEVAFRFASYAHGAPGASPAGSAVDMLPHVGLALPLLASRARSRRLAPILLVAALLVSGCASPSRSGTSLEGEITGTTVPPVYQQGNLSRQGYGSIAGQVFASDAGTGIADASAVLLGTDRFQQTDRYGRFTFRDLTAGDYHLRLDRAGYQPFEAVVAVRADLIARVNITLAPLDARGADERPHLHDYWGKDTERTLMDHEDLGTLLGTNPVCASTALGACSNQMFRVPLPTGETEYSSILPGTVLVNVTLDWDPAETSWHTAGLMVQSNNDPSLQNWTLFYPRPPGQPFRIQTAWEMTDPGHQRFSTWTFWINGAKGGCDGLTQYTPEWIQCEADLEADLVRGAVMPPTWKATVKITKGVVPIEPAHPDLWRGADTTEVIRDSLVRSQYYEYAEPTRLEPYPGLRGLVWSTAWFPTSLIPPGTLWLDVVANASRDSTVPYPVELRYKTAASGAPSLACWHQVASTKKHLDCNGPEYVHLDATTEGRTTRWRIPVTSVDTDQYYSGRSLWVFGVEPNEDPVTAASVVADRWANWIGSSEPSYSLTVIAHRDPTPS